MKHFIGLKIDSLTVPIKCFFSGHRFVLLKIFSLKICWWYNIWRFNENLWVINLRILSILFVRYSTLQKRYCSWPSRLRKLANRKQCFDYVITVIYTKLLKLSEINPTSKASSKIVFVIELLNNGFNNIYIKNISRIYLEHPFI